MRLDSFKPGLVYEEQEMDFDPVVWVVLQVHEKRDHYVTVTELELAGPNAGKVSTSTISHSITTRYKYVAGAA